MFTSLSKQWNVTSVGNSHRSASWRPTTLEEDRELFVEFSSILCFWFEIQGMNPTTFWLSFKHWISRSYLSGVLDLFDRNKILSGGDLSHYQVPHCIRVFFYFELCTYCNILDIYLS